MQRGRTSAFFIPVHFLVRHFGLETGTSRDLVEFSQSLEAFIEFTHETGNHRQKD